MNQRIILGAALLLAPALAWGSSHAAEIAHAKARIVSMLKDPASVQWKDVRWSDGADGVCGYYNAKNSFGGYTGFKYFFFGADGEVAIEDVPSGRPPITDRAQFRAHLVRLGACFHPKH